MPRFYFHVSAPGENFEDDVGSELNDLAAVHSRAVLLADRVMAFSSLREVPFNFRRWMVKVTDERQQAVITVIFPTGRALQRQMKTIPANDARTLLLRLGGMLSSHNGERRSRLS